VFAIALTVVVVAALLLDSCNDDGNEKQPSRGPTKEGTAGQHNSAISSSLLRWVIRAYSSFTTTTTRTAVALSFVELWHFCFFGCFRRQHPPYSPHQRLFERTFGPACVFFIQSPIEEQAQRTGRARPGGVMATINGSRATKLLLHAVFFVNIIKEKQSLYLSKWRFFLLCLFVACCCNGGSGPSREGGNGPKGTTGTAIIDSKRGVIIKRSLF
jgi:hypothetical protein